MLLAILFSFTKYKQIFAKIKESLNFELIDATEICFLKKFENVQLLQKSVFLND